MKQRLITLALVVALGLLAYSASEHRPQNAGLPLVSADYQRCVTVNPGPLRSSPKAPDDPRRKDIA